MVQGVATVGAHRKRQRSALDLHIALSSYQFPAYRYIFRGSYLDTKVRYWIVPELPSRCRVKKGIAKRSLRRSASTASMASCRHKTALLAFKRLH